MTHYTRGAKNLLMGQRTASWTLSKTLFAKPPRLTWNFHHPSLHNSIPQACANNTKLQFRSIVLPPDRPSESRRDPVPSSTGWNEADLIAKNMLNNGFRSWGLVIYRCTYKSHSDWEEFMRRLLFHVHQTLEYSDSLDLLDSFMPTVMDDKTRFDGVSPAIVRDYFNQWARTACETEQGVSFNYASRASSARYRLCLMVDEEALLSILNIPHEAVDGNNDTGFVILINGQWKPEFLTEEDLKAYHSPPPENNFEPVKGCTLEDVGWMNVCYDRAQIVPSAYIRNSGIWGDWYIRPPEITFNF
ncbi:Hypothetical protein PENO1_106090 [Penicillium occitanis (nom. inval.)]|nr:Hypothetical protein PENO1_106090 [Penicillium occitanis (nom. inval.)]PCG89475.1 hypothetical protein PENOC_106370 [Penicillium occitanis (nom. inval.)]